MEETFDWSKIHVKESITCTFLPHFDSSLFYIKKGKFVTRELTKEESLPSLSVTQTRAIQVHNVKALYPPTQ